MPWHLSHCSGGSVCHSSSVIMIIHQTKCDAHHRAAILSDGVNNRNFDFVTYWSRVTEWYTGRIRRIDASTSAAYASMILLWFRFTTAHDAIKDVTIEAWLSFHGYFTLHGISLYIYIYIYSWGLTRKTRLCTWHRVKSRCAASANMRTAATHNQTEQNWNSVMGWGSTFSTVPRRSNSQRRRVSLSYALVCSSNSVFLSLLNLCYSLDKCIVIHSSLGLHVSDSRRFLILVESVNDGTWGPPEQ